MMDSRELGWEVDLRFPAGIGRRMEKAKRRRVGRNAKRQNGFVGGRTIRRGGIPEQEMVRWRVVGSPDFGRAEGRTGRRFGRESGGREGIRVERVRD